MDQMEQMLTGEVEGLEVWLCGSVLAYHALVPEVTQRQLAECVIECCVLTLQGWVFVSIGRRDQT